MERGFGEKAGSSKKVNVRKPYESSSRTRVRQGSPKKKKIRKMRKIYKKTFKKTSRKKDKAM